MLEIIGIIALILFGMALIPTFLFARKVYRRVLEEIKQENAITIATEIKLIPDRHTSWIPDEIHEEIRNNGFIPGATFYPHGNENVKIFSFFQKHCNN